MRKFHRFADPLAHTSEKPSRSVFKGWYVVLGTFYSGFVALLPAVVMDAFDLTHSYDIPIFESAVTSMIAACIVAATVHAPIPQNQEARV